MGAVNLAAQTTLAQDLAVDEELEVVGLTPLGADGLNRDKLPSNVQSATDEDLQEQHLLDLSAYLNRNFAGVFVNEGTTNPLQPDVQFRGYTASPLLGLPQGLAVYQDGVRLNEPFGDTVNWALMPESAVASIDLIPGAFPVFGLNSLGGAIAIRTKNGFTHPGTSAEVTAGAWGRVIGDLETGRAFGDNEDVSYYINANYFEESGWRNFSPSEAARVFANVAFRGENSEVNIDMTWADTDLIGNGAIPFELAEEDREAIFTRPDQTENELFTVNFRGTHGFGNAKVSWNAYYRRSDIITFNGDDSDFGECAEEENLGFICEGDDDDDDDDDDDEEEGEEEAGDDDDDAGMMEDDDDDDDDDDDEEEEEVVLDASGNPIPANARTIGGTVNRTNTLQQTYGLNLQLSLDSAFANGGSNQFVVGGNFVSSAIDFDASTELGSLDDTRFAVGSGFLVDEAFTELETDTQSYSVFFINTFSPTDRLSLLLSGQFNSTEVVLRDQLGTALNGDHAFDRFNPAGGITFDLNDGIQLYAGYFESNRAPTPVELTCADPDDPCRLPNAFLADPPLDQVVARTIEAGIRGSTDYFDWSAGVFATTNEDDIIFISAGPFTNSGFFDNVGDTTRNGVELMLNGNFGERGNWFFNYTYLQAEFDEDFAVSSPNHPLADDGQIEVESGDRLTGIPEHLAKAGFSYDFLPKLTLGADVNFSSERFLRGDEANLLPTLDSFAVLNLRGEYRLNERARVFVTVENVLDENYATLGLLGEADEVLGDDFEDPRFLTPGAPRAAWVGMRFSWR